MTIVSGYTQRSLSIWNIYESEEARGSNSGGIRLISDRSVAFSDSEPYRIECRRAISTSKRYVSIVSISALVLEVD